MKLTQDVVERNMGLMVVLIILVVSVGGLVEIVPLYFQRSTTEPVAGLKEERPCRPLLPYFVVETRPSWIEWPRASLMIP